MFKVTHSLIQKIYIALIKETCSSV